MDEIDKQVEEALNLKITRKDKQQFDLIMMNMVLKPVLRLVDLFHSRRLKWESKDH